MEAVVAGQVDQGPIVDDATLVALPGDGRLHTVVEQLARCATERLEGSHMAAQQRRQVLVHHEPRPDQPAVTQHHGEQPYDPWCRRLVGEHHLELGEVDLALLALTRLEAHLEP
jgi:cation diffusion facilitator CzcD-associated flavoprotein CzcO